jgi:hypothetical protein
MVGVMEAEGADGGIRCEQQFFEVMVKVKRGGA